MTKAIIVSPPEIHQYFTEIYGSDWDTQIPVPSIAEMWSGLQNGTLSADSNIVIFSDSYLEDYSNDLAVAIASLAPDALVLVLYYDIDNHTRLTGLVNAAARTHNLKPAKFYEIDATGEVTQEIYDAFVAYEENLRKAEQGFQELVPDVEEQTHVEEPADSFSQQQRGLIIASTSSKGGSGKTTVALCTASMIYHASVLATQQGLRERPLNVCLVDMDVRDGQIGFILGQTAPTALNFLLSPEKNVNTLQDNLIYDERLGIHVLLAPKRARTADYLSEDFYQDVIQKLSTMFDVVMLDTSVNYLDPLLGKVVLPMADAVMFVSNLSVGSVYGMSRWMEEVTLSTEEGGSGIDQRKIGIVINQAAADLGIDQELLHHAAAGAQLLVAIPLDSAAVISASNHNRLSDIILYHQDISPAYYSIAKQLLPDEPLIAPLDPNTGVQEVRSNPKTSTPVAKKKKGLFR